MLKILLDVILASGQHSIADSFSALIAGTVRISPLVQNENLQRQYKPIRYVSPIEQKTNDRNSHTQEHCTEVHPWKEHESLFIRVTLSTSCSKTLFTTSRAAVMSTIASAAMMNSSSRSSCSSGPSPIGKPTSIVWRSCPVWTCTAVRATNAPWWMQWRAIS